MTIGDRIKKRRKELGLSAEEIAKKIGVNKTTVYRYESKEIEKFPTDVLEPLAVALNTTPAYLMGWEDDPAPQKPNGRLLDQSHIYMIPVYETVSAGFGAYADDHIIGYEPVYLSNEREAKETLAITVKGDSMYPKIEEGDLVIVHQQDYFENGDIVVAVLTGADEGFVKRAFQNSNKLSLESINPSYPPMTFSGTKINEIRIAGVVTKIIKNV